MRQNKIRKKTLAERLKLWILGLFLLILIILLIVPKVTSHPYIVSAKDLICMRMDSLKQALKMFKLDNGVYPSTQEGLGALIINPNSQKYSNYGDDGYIEKLPLDSWKNPYRYNHYKTDKGDDFQLISFGADGKYGGEEEDEDIIYPTCQE